MDLLFVAFCILFGIQILNFLLFIIASRRHDEVGGPQPLPVSVIVCAHDEEENLKELIPALLAQDHLAFEVIIVDDRSNDSTFDLLLAETAKDHRLRMVHVNRAPPHVNTKKYALTLGIKAARYEWILLTDADCRPNGPSWISSMTAHFNRDTNFILGYSQYQRRPGLLNAFIRFETLLTGIQYLSFASIGIPFMGVGRNMAYRRSQFLAVKGFNKIMPVTGGDDDLYVNQHARHGNTRVSAVASSQTYSIPKTTWKTFNLQKIRHLSVGKRYRIHHRIMLGLFVLSWLGTWFIGIPLAIYAHDLYIIPSMLVARELLVALTFHLWARKLDEKLVFWVLPLLDFIYAFYYLVTGMQALVTQKVRWTS